MVVEIKGKGARRRRFPVLHYGDRGVGVWAYIAAGVLIAGLLFLYVKGSFWIFETISQIHESGVRI